MITLTHIRHLSKLARVKLLQSELKKLQKELKLILDYVEKLGEARVSGIKPASHITGLENTGREDEVSEKLADADEVLKDVSEKEGRWVKVARIITKV